MPDVPLWSYKHPIWWDPDYVPTDHERAWRARVEARWQEFLRVQQQGGDPREPPPDRSRPT